MQTFLSQFTSFFSASRKLNESCIFIMLCSFISNNTFTELSSSSFTYLLSVFLPKSLMRSHKYLPVTGSLWFSLFSSGSLGRGIFNILLPPARFYVILVFSSSLSSIFLIDRFILLILFTTSRFTSPCAFFSSPGRVAQSVGHLTRKSEVLSSIPGLDTYFRFSFRWFKKGSCQLLAEVCARSTG